jgi:hypothetical protein
MESITTSIMPPEPGQNMVTLVLNKAIQPENSFSTTKTEHFPAVIRRDISTLRCLPVDDTKERGKTIQEGPDELRQKRRRLTEQANGGATSL